MKKVENLLYYIVFAVLNVFLFGILFSLLFIDKKIEYACKNDIIIGNITLLSFGIVIVWLMYCIYKTYIRKLLYKISNKNFKIIFYVAFALLFIVQLIVAYYIYFPTRWDVEILRNSSDILATGAKMDDKFAYQYYYLSYNNNVFLVVVFTIIKSIFNNISFLSGDKMVIFFSVLSVNVSGIFTVDIVNRLFKKRGLTVASFFTYAALVGLSPWIIVAYSDTYVILFTTAIIHLYCVIKTSKSTEIKTLLRWTLIFFLSGIGYYIKPTCLIVLMAVCIKEIWTFLFASLESKKKCLKVIPLAIISILAAVLINKVACIYIGFEKIDDRTVPFTHYAMMGLNDVTYGTYYRDDVTYTTSFKTHDEKVQGNIKRIKERLKDFGVIGYAKQLDRKLLTNYNDGTFAWGIGGSFFEKKGTPKNKFAERLRSLYYNGERNFMKFACTEHTIWLTILFFIIFVNLIKWTKISDTELVCILSIIGITMFTLLFESRARYLFLYSPYYIIMALAGMKALQEKTNKSK
ncbi:hypothetical protein [Eubacterium sp.]|uniref:hypothetical protein n=1 Tax=Eubacterium sp. TaxID=142586 RepID=UPI0025F3E705|nr:hypothetical protein [Eubacterium sp.]MCR5628234.1 hypothetical protein [Eubacterium sp.]